MTRRSVKVFTVKVWSPTARQMIVLKLNAEDETHAKAAAKGMGLKLVVVQGGDTADPKPGGDPPEPTETR